jgi:hypothetical protein
MTDELEYPPDPSNDDDDAASNDARNDDAASNDAVIDYATEIDAAGTQILSGRPVVVLSISLGDRWPAVRHATIHRSRGGWMLIYRDNGQVEFRDPEMVRRTVIRTP